jgi:hypothetical protein
MTAEARRDFKKFLRKFSTSCSPMCALCSLPSEPQGKAGCHEEEKGTPLTTQHVTTAHPSRLRAGCNTPGNGSGSTDEIPRMFALAGKTGFAGSSHRMISSRMTRRSAPLIFTPLSPNP